MHIIPEYGYIAISKTYKYYLTLSLSHLMMCRQIEDPCTHVKYTKFIFDFIILDDDEDFLNW